ncbi:MAG TPA: DUF4232 domain-containing protein [Candidatus Acidoferrum sp.]|nr:DUF4232 domain-containing protein [Candidatus Acidoferrum sp.]
MHRIVLIGVLAVVLGGCAGNSTPEPSSPNPTAAPSSSAPSDVPSAEPSPSATPKPSPRPIAACLATQLSATVTAWSGAAGSQIATVKVTNTSTATCTIQGTPEVELVDAHGAILIDSQTSGPSGLPHVATGAPAHHLAHNASLKTQVKADNYCGSGSPALPTTIAFVLPSGGGRLVAAPGPGGAVPPCNGAAGSLGTIVTNGWSR